MGLYYNGENEGSCPGAAAAVSVHVLHGRVLSLCVSAATAWNALPAGPVAHPRRAGGCIPAAAHPNAKSKEVDFMSVINILSPHVADLIAAGEVVERPASVVKELVENSIDAGAKNITVELRGGGMRLIRVSDDGCGMTPEDAGIAFLRHATSKLHDERGLESIATLGFRGEALAAISSVSRIELLTRRRGDGEGTRVLLTAGDIDEMGPAGCREGTVMAVRDLFFNTPARLKFTKSDKAEGAACTAIALRCALGHPEVSVRLIRDGEEVFFSPGDGQAKSAVYSLLGRENAAGLIECAGENDAVSVSGFVSAPHAGRGSRGMQYFFINGRAFKSASIQAALEQAYKNTLLTGRFPGCVLYLTLSPGRVDVNVHPAKTEVKFTDEKRVFDCVYSAVCAALASSRSTAELTLSKTTRGAVSGVEQGGRAASDDEQGFDPYGGAFKVRSAARSLLDNIPPASKSAAANRAAMAAQGRDVTVFDPGTRPLEPLTLRAPTVGYAHSPLVPRPEIPVIHRDGSITGSWPEPCGAAGTDRAEAEGAAGGSAGGAACGSGTDTVCGAACGSGSGTDTVCGAVSRDDSCGAPDVGGQAGSGDAGDAGRCVRASGVRPGAAHTGDTPGGSGGADEQVDGSGGAASSYGTAQDTSDAAPLTGPGPAFRYIGETMNAYILVETADGLLLIDKHAAHERMNFDRLMQGKGEIMSQSLLTPITWDPGEDTAELIDGSLPLLEQAGFEVDRFGAGSVIIRSVPQGTPLGGETAMLEEICQKLRDGLTDDRRDEILHSVACKAAIKAGMTSDEQELRRIAEAVVAGEVKYCPHGRPVSVLLTRKELDKQFKRIV
jgi:DNA mismatch repair protein MutL